MWTPIQAFGNCLWMRILWDGLANVRWHQETALFFFLPCYLASRIRHGLDGERHTLFFGFKNTDYEQARWYFPTLDASHVRRLSAICLMKEFMDHIPLLDLCLKNLSSLAHFISRPEIPERSFIAQFYGTHPSFPSNSVIWINEA